MPKLFKTNCSALRPSTNTMACCQGITCAGSVNSTMFEAAPCALVARSTQHFKHPIRVHSAGQFSDVVSMFSGESVRRDVLYVVRAAHNCRSIATVLQFICVCSYRLVCRTVFDPLPFMRLAFLKGGVACAKFRVGPCIIGLLIKSRSHLYGAAQ